jgi:hypothetical protein
VGFGDRHREKKLIEAHASWQAHVDDVNERLDAVRTWYGGDPADPDSAGLLLKAGEKPYAVLEGAALIEPRRAPGQFVGGSHGVSLHIAKGVNYRVGAVRGTYVPGPESPTPIDTGRAVITDQRVTFGGMKASREWLYAKLIGCQHDPGNWTVLQVSNRQKASGIGYDAEHAAGIRFRLDLAIATYTGHRSALQSQLEAQLNELLGSEPERPVASDHDAIAAPAPPAAPAQPAAIASADSTPTTTLPPAGWYPDNADASLNRYWDGTAWTAYTSPR